MKNRIYAMDTHFMCDNEGLKPSEQAAMVKATGYPEYYMTTAVYKPELFEETLKASLEAGIGFNAVFERFEIEKPPSREDLEGVDRVLSQLPKGARFEISMTCDGFGQNVGDSSKDDLALAWLGPVSCLLEKHGIEGSLYPHFAFTLETLEDALRLARKVNHPLMKVMFTSYHWFYVRTKEEKSQPPFADLFAEAGDLLNAVNLCGSRNFADDEKPFNQMNPSIEPLDSGTKDVAGIVAELKRIGFTGSIGVQGYGVNTTSEDSLTRSFKWLNEHLA